MESDLITLLVELPDAPSLHTQLLVFRQEWSELHQDLLTKVNQLKANKQSARTGPNQQLACLANIVTVPAACRLIKMCRYCNSSRHNVLRNSRGVS